MKVNPIRQTVYKVLWRNPANKLLYSCTEDIRRSHFNVRYRKNSITRPKVGKLFIFADKGDALKFADSDCEVWEAEGYNCQKALGLRLPTFQMPIESFKEMVSFWTKREAKNDPALYTMPDGTYLCSSLKLIKQVI